MIKGNELTIGALVRSNNDYAKVTALYKEDDGIHVEGNVFCGDDSSPEEDTFIPCWVMVTRWFSMMCLTTVTSRYYMYTTFRTFWQLPTNTMSILTCRFFASSTH